MMVEVVRYAMEEVWEFSENQIIISGTVQFKADVENSSFFATIDLIKLAQVYLLHI